jgi:hypothetical protein
MNTRFYRRLSILVAISASAWALTGCTAEMGESDPEETAGVEEIDGEQETDGETAEGEEDVAEAEQAILASAVLYQWQSMSSPTWSFWAFTDIAFTNNSSSWGKVSLKAGLSGENVWVAPYTTQYIRRQYAALPVTITNVGTPPIHVVTW